MRLTRVLISIASFSFALVTGFRTGANLNIIEKFMSHTVSVDTTPDVPIPNNDQFNLLVIGVDNAKSKDAKLQSIWIIAFPQKPSRLNLLPLFPSVNDPVQNLLLAEAFQLKNGQPSQEFWDVMKETGTWWNEFFVSDKAGLANLVDALGGITVDGKQLNGSQAQNSIPSWKYDPQIALEQQKIIFEGICNRISRNHSLGTPTGVFLKTMHLSKNTGMNIRYWITQISANKGLGCYFPTFIEIPIPPTIVVR